MVSTSTCSTDLSVACVGVHGLIYSPPQSYRTFIYDQPGWSRPTGESRVTLLEEQVAIQAGTTGLRTWTARYVLALHHREANNSLHLAHHILHSPHIFASNGVNENSTPSIPPCIELGAGTGFLSILLAQLGADVIATDLDGPSDGVRQMPLERLRRNVKISRSHFTAVVLQDASDVR